MYFNRWYSALYVICYLILFIYKGTSQSGTSHYLEGDMTCRAALPVPTNQYIYMGSRLYFLLRGDRSYKALFRYDILRCNIASALTLYLASKGNKTEQVTPLIWSMLMAVPIVLCNLYYFQFQVYVYVVTGLFACPYPSVPFRLRFDVVLNAISLSLLSLEAALSGLTCIVFSRANRF